jgi:hypothetical protein
VNDHPDIDREWYYKSNYLGLLSVKSEKELMTLVSKSDKLGIRYSIFREPDIGYQITAIALTPGPMSKRICSGLSLALKD